MRISHATLFLGFAACGASAALALNTPHTLHHSKTPHLQDTHNAAPHSPARHAAVANAPAAVPHSAAKASVHTTTRTAHSGASLRNASLHTTHRSYERFTGNSFATSDIFGADVTTGEDPVVRQAAIEALRRHERHRRHHQSVHYR